MTGACTSTPSQWDVDDTGFAHAHDMRCNGQVQASASGGFTVNSSTLGDVPSTLEAFRRGWATKIGDAFPLPDFGPVSSGDVGGRLSAGKVYDAALVDLDNTAATRTTRLPEEAEDCIRLYVVRRGAWSLDDPYDRGDHTVTAGHFLFQHVRHTVHFQTVSGTSARILLFPTGPLQPLLGGRAHTGRTDVAEVRVLLAHAAMLQANLASLNPVGIRAGYNALIELASAVALGQFDGAEPVLRPALAQAARSLADRHLADPDLSSAGLARQLHVSVRTLQRAFAETGESVSAYIRNRRLDEARIALRSGRLSVSEIAAHWQFTDSSHFIRAFKQRNGRTPTDFTRTETAIADTSGPAGRGQTAAQS